MPEVITVCFFATADSDGGFADLMAVLLSIGSEVGHFWHKLARTQTFVFKRNNQLRRQMDQD